MKKTVNPLILSVLFLFLSSCVTKYYFVRHAEKACEDCSTCGLTPDGNLRAAALRDTLFTKGIDTIFASQCLRTQLTAKPLSLSLNKKISIYQTGQLNTFINNLRSFRSNKSILVVGHSNQIPEMVDSLAHQHVFIGINDFDNMFVVTRTILFTTSFRVQSLTYGNPTE